MLGDAAVASPVANSRVSSNVVARAATTQKVVGSGTKVASATENTVTDDACRAKYNGCMDTFCMVDNETGGRCICNNKIFDLDKILAEIEQQDLQSYKLATVGVETIESGVDIAAITRRSKADSNLTNLWNAQAQDTTAETERGARLMATAHEFCVAQIPGCESEIQMLQLMYGQQTKSDCAAYENALKQQKQQSRQKLDAANRAVRSAALDRLRTTNKYDLGQCTVEFKKCMQTTGGCGDDFSGCATVVALDATNTRKSTSRQAKNYQIKGVATNIEISASTYETLMAKKPLCESITKSCVNVAGQVWDTFLREVAPQIKNAELIAEDKARQNCIGNIASCFQKACKDNIDPRDPDGSYDMCLSRPGTMLNLCRVPLNACGIDASSQATAEKSSIWDYVLARLAAMRVNSCTTQVKECLQSEDRCGKDYTQCIGLDTDTIIRMCPYDKLTGCQKIYGDADIRGDAVYDELAYLVQGLMVNIDNAMLEECQAAVDEAMIRVCGTTENCNNMTVNQNIGANTLEYKICPYVLTSDALLISNENCYNDVKQIPAKDLGRVEGARTGELGPVTPLTGNMTGIIYWASVNMTEEGRLSSVDEYIKNAELEGVMTTSDMEKVGAEIGALQKSIDSVINAIESDPTVQYCMTGRRVRGMRDMKIGSGVARLPNLTKQMRMIIGNSALKIARENYLKKYDELMDRMLIDSAKIAERQAEIRGENTKDVYREMARYSCIAMADLASLPNSPAPPKGIGGKLVVGIILVAAIVVAAVFTFGAGGIAAGAGASAATSATAAAGVPGGIAGSASTAVSSLASSIATSSSLAASKITAIVAWSAAGAALFAGGVLVATDKYKDGSVDKGEAQLSGRAEMNQWNYREIVTTTFEWDNMVCRKCVESQRCAKEKTPFFGKKSCKLWGDKETTCTDTQF